VSGWQPEKDGWLAGGWMKDGRRLLKVTNSLEQGKKLVTGEGAPGAREESPTP